MRLTEYQLKKIREVFSVCFLDADRIWLFGSRVDDLKKGGDIDLYIETHYDDLSVVAEKEIIFLRELKKKIGDQKIDIVINTLKNNKNLPIYNEAKGTGVQLK